MNQFTSSRHQHAPIKTSRILATTKPLALLIPPDVHTPLHSGWQQRLTSLLTATALSVTASLNSPYSALASVGSSTINPPIPTTFPSLPTIKSPSIQRFSLQSNGLKVILLEDHEVPLVSGVLLMRGGQRAVSESQVGIASISSAVQRTGGSQQHPKEEFDIALENLGAVIEGGAGPESLSLGFECLAEDTSEVLSLFTELLTSPALPDERVKLVRDQALNATQHRNDDSGGIASREATKLVYGKNSVYVRQATEKTLANISKEDVRNFLSTWQRPDTAVLGIVGDFKASEMRALLDKELGTRWKAPPRAPPVLETSPIPDQTANTGRIFLVDIPGSSQTSVAVAEPGITMGDPDEFALDILSSLLNGFGGRLFDGIRSREGLAYSIGAGWSTAAPDHPGIFLASAETAKPVELLRALRAALTEAATQTPAVDDVDKAKEQSLNTFVFAFGSPQAQLRRAAVFELLGIPKDYLMKYRDGLSKVTAGDVASAAQNWLHPEKQTIVVAGDGKKLKSMLEKELGLPVEELKLD